MVDLGRICGPPNIGTSFCVFSKDSDLLDKSDSLCSRFVGEGTYVVYRLWASTRCTLIIYYDFLSFNVCSLSLIFKVAGLTLFFGLSKRLPFAICR